MGDCLLMCTQVLASKLDTAVVNFSSGGPQDPGHTSVYPSSNNRMFLPSPLSYLPQVGTGIGSQQMVRRPRNPQQCADWHILPSDSPSLRLYMYAHNNPLTHSADAAKADCPLAFHLSVIWTVSDMLWFACECRHTSRDSGISACFCI